MIIGALFKEPECARDLCDSLCADDFTLEVCDAIFSAWKTRTLANQLADIPLVASDVAVEVPEAAKFIRECVRITPTTANLHLHSCRLHEIGEHRRLQRRTEEAVASGESAAEIAGHLTEIARETLENSRGDLTLLQQGMIQVLEEVSAEDRPRPSYTGFPALDEIAGGFHPGEIIIIAARPAVGKSSLAMQIADYCACRRESTLYISLEMTTKELCRRQIMRNTGLTAAQLDNPEISREELSRIMQCARHSQQKLYFSDKGGLQVDELRALAHQVPELRLLVVDYVGLLDTGKAGQSTYEKVTEISHKLKSLAMELRIPVIVLAQLNREISPNERPALSNLRDSGALEQDADKVLLWRADEENGVVGCDVAKNRSGRTGEVEFDFIGERFRYENCRPHPRLRLPKYVEGIA